MLAEPAPARPKLDAFSGVRRLLEARMGESGKREFVQVLRLLEVIRPDDVLAGIRAFAGAWRDRLLCG